MDHSCCLPHPSPSVPNKIKKLVSIHLQLPVWATRYTRLGFLSSHKSHVQFTCNYTIKDSSCTSSFESYKSFVSEVGCHLNLTACGIAVTLCVTRSYTNIMPYGGLKLLFNCSTKNFQACFSPSLMAILTYLHKYGKQNNLLHTQGYSHWIRFTLLSLFNKCRT